MGTKRLPYDEALPMPTIGVSPPNIVTAQLGAWTAVNPPTISLQVPAGETWEPKIVHARFLASATVGSRNPLLEIQDASGVTVAQVGANSGVVTASSVGRYSAFAGAQIITAPPYYGWALPSGLFLPPGYKIRLFDIYNIDSVLDQWTSAALMYYKW